MSSKFYQKEIRKMTSQKSKFAQTALISALAALTAVTTIMVRVPIPATNGYFNIGDVFIILAGLWLGPKAGLIVGAVGSSVADAVGFPVYIPATFAVKGLEGLVAGLPIKKTVAALLAAIVMVAGYYVFEAFIYPMLGNKIPMFAITTPEAALIALFPNAVQGIAGAVGGLALWHSIANKK